MPKGLNHKSIPLMVALLVFALSVATALPAFAALEDAPEGMTSTTNPFEPINPDTFWRWHWGNSLDPQLTVGTVPTDPDIATSGMYYLFDQSESATPTAGDPNLSGVPQGSMMSGTFDVNGIMSETGWIQQPGAVKRGEGLWYLHFRFYNQFRAQNGHWDLPFGIDQTAPQPVSGLVAGVTSTQPTNEWTTSTRRVLRWTPMAYDALSGVGGFAISVNGEEKVLVRNVAPDPAVEWWAALLNPVGATLPQISTATIEDLGPGNNKIGVTVVDRATNRSTTQYVYAKVDTDTPTIAITSPTATLVGKTADLAATATDLGGVASVVFKIDGTTVATDSTAPYTASVNMVPFGSGAHTITATVTDMYGRTATTTKTIMCDITSPALSIVSKGPSPFYPKKRNGYRDDYIIKMASSETATAKLVFKTSKGTTFKTIVKTVPAGTTSIKWNGKSGGGNFKEGTYSWTLYLTDAAGNASVTKSGSATERFYQLKRVSKSKVKLVLR